MRPSTTSRAKRSGMQSKKQSAKKQFGDDESPLTSALARVMTTVRAGEELTGTVETLARSVDSLTRGEASHAVTQVRDTLDSATVTAQHARKTFRLGKTAVEGIRNSMKGVFEQMKEKPEPFVAAALPSIVGLYLFIRRSQSARSKSLRLANG